MRKALQLKIKRRKRINRKGFSSIVGAIFMVLITWSLASSYFFFTASQNTTYNQAVRQRNELDIARMSESIQTYNTTFVVSSNGVVRVSTTFQNIGSYSVQLITLWLHASNSTGWKYYGFSEDIGVTLQAGEVLTVQDFYVNVQGVSISGLYTFSSWFITSRGTTVPLRQANTENIVVSQTTNGIGALMMSFQEFIYYRVLSSPYRLDIASGSSGYTVTTGGADIAFRVILTNLDYQTQNDITLYSNSVFFSIFPTTETQVRGSYWYIVNVNEITGAISSDYTNIVLRYNVPTPVYFASANSIEGYSVFSPNGPGYTGTSPINLALVGTKGTQPFGQNIPFVSILVS